MNAEPATPRDRLRAGEIVRFDEITPEDMAAMFPLFATVWERVAQIDVVIPSPPEGQAAA